MMSYPPRAARDVILRRALLAVAVLTSAAAVVVVGFAVSLFASGYSGDGDPQSMSGLAFPIAFLILGVVGLPLMLASAASWAGYLSAARKNRRLPR